MRLPSGLVTPPVIVVGWIASVICLMIIIRLTPKLENRELTKMAIVGGLILVVSSIQIPFLVFPVLFNLTGIGIALLLFGMRKGILISSGAMILNHLLLPGALENLGINLLNMMIISFIMGYFSHKFIGARNSGSRYKYLISFFTGFGYIVLEASIILSELVIMHTTEVDLQITGAIVLAYIFFLGILEGFFTAISYSYLTRTGGTKFSRELISNLDLSQDERKSKSEKDVEYDED